MDLDGTSEGWDDVLDQLHRAAGKLDARARIDHLMDPGTFHEIGTLVGGEEAPADAVVIGCGLVDGRPVLAAVEDFTVKAGTISQASLERGLHRRQAPPAPVARVGIMP